MVKNRVSHGTYPSYKLKMIKYNWANQIHDIDPTITPLTLIIIIPYFNFLKINTYIVNFVVLYNYSIS